MFGRFLTSILWGIAADKYGRKPVMIIGVFSVLVGLSSLSLLYRIQCASP
jgi:MFS family permease